MLDKDAVGKILDRTPLFIIIVGLIIFIIGAAGGLPIGDPPLQVSDTSWRLALGIVGILLLVIGILLLLRENATEKRQSKNAGNMSPEEFFIWLDHPNRPTFEELFKDATRICLVGKTAINVLGGNSRHFRDMANNGCRLQFMFPKPTLNKAIYSSDPDRYKKNFEVTKSALKEIKRVAGERMQVKLINQIPTMAMIIIERKNPEKNKILVQLYFVRAHHETDRPVFIVPYKDKWYETFIYEFDELWKDGELWDLATVKDEKA
jgi:hypothetical protein